MSNRNKTILTWAVIIVLAASYAIWRGMSETDSPSGQDIQADSNAQTEATTTENVVRRNRSSIAPSLSYEEAFEKYQGRLLTFDAGCIAPRREITFKNPTEVMVDNRSGASRTVSLDGQTIRLDAYDFTILKLSTSAPLPHDVIVNCDSNRNVMNLTLQK